MAELIFSVEPTPWSNEPNPDNAPVVVIVPSLVRVTPVATVRVVPALMVPAFETGPLIFNALAAVIVPLFVKAPLTVSAVADVKVPLLV